MQRSACVFKRHPNCIWCKWIPLVLWSTRPLGWAKPSTLEASHFPPRIENKAILKVNWIDSLVKAIKINLIKFQLVILLVVIWTSGLNKSNNGTKLLWWKWNWWFRSSDAEADVSQVKLNTFCLHVIICFYFILCDYRIRCPRQFGANGTMASSIVLRCEAKCSREGKEMRIEKGLEIPG